MANRLNTKEITRCTLRFYDSDFVKKLNDLYGKIGGTQQAFLGMLVNVGIIDLLRNDVCNVFDERYGEDRLASSSSALDYDILSLALI